MPGTVALDAYGHEITNQDTSTQLTAGAVSVVTAGTISGTTSAGAAPTVTVTDATDRRGNFLLTAVTGGGAQAAGTVCTVRFVKPYGKKPGAVLCCMANETDGNLVVANAIINITGDGFDIMTGAVLVTAKAYRVNYIVIP